MRHFFHLNGKVNSIHGSAWSPAPVKMLHEQPLHSPKVLVWCGFKTDFLMDPFFFDNPIKGAAYRDMLINHVEPQLRSHHCLTKTVFQQDGAPPHIEKSVKEYLSNRFPGNFSWPLRSPDLNPMDFFFWGYFKNKVYQDEIFYNRADLRQKITSCIAEIGCDL